MKPEYSFFKSSTDMIARARAWCRGVARELKPLLEPTAMAKTSFKNGEKRLKLLFFFYRNY